MARELKAIYRAETAEAAAKRLWSLDAGAWADPMIAESRRRNWEQIIPLLRFRPGGAKNHVHHQRDRKFAYATAQGA